MNVNVHEKMLSDGQPGLHYRKGIIVPAIDRTRRTSKTLLGFDYAAGKPVERTTQEWRRQLQQLVTHGGRVKHEHHETFGVAKNDPKHPRALIEFEIYGYVK